MNPYDRTWRKGKSSVRVYVTDRPTENVIVMTPRFQFSAGTGRKIYEERYVGPQPSTGESSSDLANWALLPPRYRVSRPDRYGWVRVAIGQMRLRIRSPRRWRLHYYNGKVDISMSMNPEPWR